jgi:hypothetical protein
MEQAAMDEIWARFVTDLVERLSGPMKFRLLLQPAVACFLAFRAGLGDARMGKPPYFWALLTDPAHRREMLREGWKSIGKVFVLALVLDVAYQLYVLEFIYPGEALVIGIALAIIPYLVVRGLVNRLWSG